MNTTEAFTAGTVAFHAGTARSIAVAGIEDFIGADGTLNRDLAHAWYAGWDHANLAAPVA